MTQSVRSSALRAACVAWAVFACTVAWSMPFEPSGRPGSTTVDFASDRDYPPFAFVDADGDPAGFDVELFRAVAAHAGLSARVQLDDWDRVVARLGRGEVDVVPMLVTEERRRRFRFSEPFLHRYHLVFGERSDTFVPHVDALADKRVAVQVAGMAWEELRRRGDIDLVEVPIEGEALRAVEQGRADYAVVPMFIGYAALQRYGLDDIVALSPPLLERQYAFAVPPQQEWLLARINAGLEATSRSGVQNELYLEWLANLTPTADVYRSGLRIGLMVAAALLAVAAVLFLDWRRTRRRVRAESRSRAGAEARARHLELFDAVTQLPNRLGFRERLQPWIQAQEPFALIRIELTDLGAVEAMAGHGFVDRLLAVVAQRLQANPDAIAVARIGQAGFAIAHRRCRTPEQAHAAMRELIAQVGGRMELLGVPVEQRSHAGAALFPQHGWNADELLRTAGVAAVAALRRPGRVEVYAPTLEPDPRNLSLLADLHLAIGERALGYALQPKLDLRTRRVAGAELLVRWQHPKHGTLAPSVFVPLAENTELIGEMTVYLLRHAAAHCREWQRLGRALDLSVNVSVNDLSNAAVVDQLIGASGGVAARLVLEVTETAVMQHPAEALAAVERLRARGLRISLDDFGTGNASLTYLRQLRPDEVKIDRSFIAGIGASEADRSIVHSTIQLAHSLGACVTAEGVEDAGTLEWLAEAGCDYAQGHFIGRPLPADAFMREFGQAAAPDA